MNLNELNSLTDLYFYQAKKQNPQDNFLEWLHPQKKIKFTWLETSLNIYQELFQLLPNLKVFEL